MRKWHITTLSMAGAACLSLSASGCGGTEDAGTSAAKGPAVARSSQSAPPSPSGAERDGDWHVVNSARLPPDEDAATAKRDDDGKDLAKERQAIDAGTPDPCAFMTMRTYSNITKHDAYIAVHGGGPYVGDPTSSSPADRRNCYITKGEWDGKLKNNPLTGEVISVYKDPDGYMAGRLRKRLAGDEPCAIGPQGYVQKVQGCTVVDLDPYGAGFDRSRSNANVPDAWFNLQRDGDGVDTITVVIKTSNGYLTQWTCYGADQGAALNGGRIIANGLRVAFGLDDA
ncbi:hypothetical protein ACF08B_29240 [Streptomyces sp. NPDC015139]|uniref:hypothetical protein n=1 Tax=Streptomyces sp. NPDC015139 TaxID=3364942 RepID=UPI0036F71ED5